MNCVTCTHFFRDQLINLDTREPILDGKGKRISIDYCRRYPPQPIDRVNSTFPVVNSSSICGEFTASKTAAPTPKRAARKEKMNGIGQ